MAVFAGAHGAGDSWLQACRICLDRLGSPPAGASLGFLYVTEPLAEHLSRVFAFFRNATGIEHWVGAAGPGVCGGDREYYDEPAIALLLAALPPESFRLFGSVTDTLADFRDAHLPWCVQQGSRFAIAHGDPRNFLVPELLLRLNAATGAAFVGGLNSSGVPYPQLAGEVTGGGLSGVLLAGDVAVTTGLTQSCAPFGDTYRVTEAVRNVAVTLNDRPALDVFLEEIGELLARDLERAARYIGVALPVPGEDPRHYLVRNVVAVDLQQRLLAVGEALFPGQEVRFCRRDAGGAREDMERMLRGVRKRLPAPPAGALYFSCTGRGRHMFGENSAELAMVREVFPDIPLAGFFCNGEISGNRLYGYTGVLAVFA